MKSSVDSSDARPRNWTSIAIPFCIVGSLNLCSEAGRNSSACCRARLETLRALGHRTLHHACATCFSWFWSRFGGGISLSSWDIVMPEHFHLLISEPQERSPSTVMQALKLGFARRVLIQMASHRNVAQTELFEHACQHI